MSGFIIKNQFHIQIIEKWCIALAQNVAIRYRNGFELECSEMDNFYKIVFHEFFCQDIMNIFEFSWRKKHLLFFYEYVSDKKKKHVY